MDCRDPPRQAGRCRHDETPNEKRDSVKPTSTTTVALALAALLMSGCSGAETKPAAAGSSASSSPSPSVDPFAPNLGDRALEIGETRRGMDVETTLQEVRTPYPPAEYREPEEGNEFIGMRIKQCTKEGVSDPGETTYNAEWYAVTPSGDEYTGGHSWDDWPSPKFPELTGAIAGRCVKGWIAFEVPKDTNVETILWRPGGDPIAEWFAQP